MFEILEGSFKSPKFNCDKKVELWVDIHMHYSYTQEYIRFD